MTSKERVQASLNHVQPDRMAVDFGATVVTGIHCKIIEQLRDYYGLEKRPVKIVEPGQMLGEIDSELIDIIGVDCIPVFGRTNKWGCSQEHFHEETAPWGQQVLIADGLSLETDKNGEVHFWPLNDHSVEPSGIIPEGGYFADYVERVQEFDEEHQNPLDSIEEFGIMGEETLDYFEKNINKAYESGKAVVASFGGTALGDVANVPGVGLLHPKGIRSITEWYMSTIIRQDYIHAMFEEETNRALINFENLYKRVGNKVDVIYMCGTDFGTQESQFCSVETFRELWLPYYKKITDWVHQNTSWKVFKHSCGSVYPLISSFIDAGIDALNPVQINAKDMDPARLKAEFGSHITFWGGGADTQKILPFAKPEEVRSHVLRECEILGKDGGFIFNSVHNVQANVPIENVVAMIDAINEFRK